jgi:DNA-binding LacI/PurR family transcriptional regulator
MAQRFLDLKSRPSALCIVNEYAASAFVNEIQRRGWRVPDDISLVSHDDAPVARFCAVPLTTVSHPVEDIANQVVRLLRERLENDYGGPARQITIKGQLVVRDSSRSYLA